MLVGGVDEAGRGCVLGPLAVAGVSVESSRLEELAALGVKDSKLLSPNQREALYPEIVKSLQGRGGLAHPPEDDRPVREQGEEVQAAELPGDHPHGEGDRRARGGRGLHRRSRHQPSEVQGGARASSSRRKPRIVAEHKADVNYPVVSAASIIAKVERDRDIAELRELHGDFGSGYPSGWLSPT